MPAARSGARLPPRGVFVRSRGGREKNGLRAEDVRATHGGRYSWAPPLLPLAVPCSCNIDKSCFMGTFHTSLVLLGMADGPARPRGGVKANSLVVKRKCVDRVKNTPSPGSDSGLAVGTETFRGTVLRFSAEISGVRRETTRVPPLAAQVLAVSSPIRLPRRV